MITTRNANENEQTIVAYKYQTTFVQKDKIGILNRYEYFIPSENICFNEKEAFRSETPKNTNNYLDHSPTFLRKIFLQKELVLQIINKLGTHNRTNLDIEMDKKFLFSNWLYGFFAREMDFEKNYKLYGNQILPEYILRYINDVDLNKNTATVTRIFNIIQSLDDVERRSLEDCLTARIQEREDRFKKYNIKESSISKSDGLLSLGVGVGLACLSESIPAGILTGAFTLFGKSIYNLSKKEQCETFKQNIFDALNTKHEIKHQI